MPINATEILEKYDLNDKSCDPKRHEEMKEKWESHTPEQWYGYALGGCPTTWANIIDDFLTQLKEFDPNFEIHQIKQKFGGIRIYLSFSDEINKNYGVISHINQQTAILEHELFHESLIF